jgi:hypothetical protein
VTFGSIEHIGMLAMNGTDSKQCSKQRESVFLTAKVTLLSVHVSQAYVEMEIRLHSFLISAQGYFESDER